MARRPKATLVKVIGYGEDEGTDYTLELDRVEADTILLTYVNPINREQSLSIPFRRDNGRAVGSKPTRGYKIPKSVRRQLTENVESDTLKTDEGKVPQKGNKMKLKTKAGKTESPKAKMKVSSNGKAKVSSKPEPTKSITKAKANVKGAAPAASGRPGRKPSIERPEPGKREMLLKLSEGLAAELAGAKRLGPELKAAVKAAVKDGNYTLIVVDKETAGTLLEVLAKLSGTWAGVRGARLRVGVSRIASEINERFKIKIPAELAAKPAAAPEPKKVKPTVKPKKAVVEDDDEEDEEETPKPKKVKKLKKKNKKS